MAEQRAAELRGAEKPSGGLTGMTVNERLAARGLSAAWAEATQARDGAAMLLLLRRVAMPNAKAVVDLVLADPAAYGF